MSFYASWNFVAPSLASSSTPSFNRNFGLYLNLLLKGCLIRNHLQTIFMYPYKTHLNVILINNTSLPSAICLHSIEKLKLYFFLYNAILGDYAKYSPQNLSFDDTQDILINFRNDPRIRSLWLQRKNKKRYGSLIYFFGLDVYLAQSTLLTLSFVIFSLLATRELECVNMLTISKLK